MLRFNVNDELVEPAILFLIEFLFFLSNLFNFAKPVSYQQLYRFSIKYCLNTPNLPSPNFFLYPFFSASYPDKNLNSKCNLHD